jgi:hypothetical protein
MCGEKLERQIKIGRQKKSCEQQLQITRVTFSFSYFLSQMCIAFPCAAVPQAGRPRQHTQQPTRPKSPEPGASLPCAHFCGDWVRLPVQRRLRFSTSCAGLRVFLLFLLTDENWRKQSLL